MNQLIETNWGDAQKEYERQRVKQYYDTYLAVKVNCPRCGKELTRGAMARHQKSSLCKTVDERAIEQAKAKERRQEYIRNYSREWRLEHDNHIREYNEKNKEKDCTEKEGNI